MSEHKGGRIAANFRNANIAEELAILLFKPFCAIANVLRQEDYGIDFIGTLLRKNGKVLSAENSFVAQIKIQSSPVFQFSGEGVEWLRNLELPYFPITVNLNDSSVSVYSLNSWLHPIFTSIVSKYNFVVQNEFCVGDGLDDFPLGNPIMVWSITDAVQADFPFWAYSIFKKFVEIESNNFQFGRLWRFEQVECETFRFSKENPNPEIDLIKTSILEIPPGMPEDVKQIIDRALASLPNWIQNQQYDIDKSESLLDLKRALKELNIDPDPNDNWEEIAKNMKLFCCGKANRHSDL
jgi:hypothetical protein